MYTRRKGGVNRRQQKYTRKKMSCVRLKCSTEAGLKAVVHNVHSNLSNIVKIEIRENTTRLICLIRVIRIHEKLLCTVFRVYILKTIDYHE